MNRQKQTPLTAALVLVSLLVITGCQKSRTDLDLTPTPFTKESENEEGDPFIGVPNPASFYCEEMGYQVELRTAAGGTQGICIFPDGRECEEWEFLAGGCSIEWTYCQRQGYNIREGEDGAICTFNDGSTCPEYEFFIGDCQPPK